MWIRYYLASLFTYCRCFTWTGVPWVVEWPMAELCLGFACTQRAADEQVRVEERSGRRGIDLAKDWVDRNASMTCIAAKTRG
jgi:hypothetical protein